MFVLCARKEWSGYIISLSFVFVIVGMLGVKKTSYKRRDTDTLNNFSGKGYCIELIIELIFFMG
jgi:hypothetical protein